MSISMEELNPFIDDVYINNHLCRTTPFTLYMEVWAIKHFKTLENFIQKVKEGDVVSVYAAFYYLLKDNKLTYEDFIKKVVLKDKKEMKTNGQKIADHIADLLTNAQPLIKNTKRMREIDEALGRGEGSVSHEDNYAVYFDKVARRYGYTVDQFYSLTSRQLHSIFKAMDSEDHKALEVRAALNGRKLKERIDYKDISVEQEKEHEDQALAALDRLRARQKDMNNGS